MAEYLRLLVDEEVQTSTLRYQHPDTGRRVTLVGTQHVGQPSYFDALHTFIRGLEDGGAVVQCEGSRLMPCDAPDITAAEQRLLERMWRVDDLEAQRLAELGWIGQIPALGYPTSWQVIDRSYLDLIRSLGADLVGAQIAQKESMFDWPDTDPTGPARLRQMVTTILRTASNDKFVRQLGERDATLAVLLRDRTRIALDGLATTDRDTVLLWGAAHLPGLAHDLRQAGYARTGDPQWQTAARLSLLRVQPACATAPQPARTDALRLTPATNSPAPPPFSRGKGITMTGIKVALFNFQDGGRLADGRYDFGRLQRAFADVRDPPALILLCEAKNYRDHAGVAKYAAAEALSDALDVPYVAELGCMQRGPMPPAIFYDPDRLVLRRWWNQDDPGVYDDQRNVARFAVRASGHKREERTEFLAFVHHWEPLSGDARLEEARRVSRYGGSQPLPVIGGGDFNATASGSHLPQRDWMAATVGQRRHKGICLPDGTWGPDTRALDYLIGAWDGDAGQRRDGCGLHSLAEMAWRDDPTQPILPTVNDGVDAGGGLLIDWLVGNDAMLPHIIRGSYRVYVPPADGVPFSDHRLVTAEADL